MARYSITIPGKPMDRRWLIAARFESTAKKRSYQFFDDKDELIAEVSATPGMLVERVEDAEQVGDYKS